MARWKQAQSAGKFKGGETFDIVKALSYRSLSKKGQTSSLDRETA